MTLSRTDVPALFKAELYPVMFEELNRYPLLAGEFCKMDTTTKAYEQSTSMVGFGMFDETAEGGPIQEDAIDQGYITYARMWTYTKKMYVTWQAIQHDLKGVMSQITKWGAQIAAAYVDTQNQVASDYLNYGALTAGQARFNQSIAGLLTYSPGNYIYDGKPLLAASGNNHPLHNSTATKYNSIGATALAFAGIKTGYDLMAGTNNVNERNQPITIGPDTLMVHPLSEGTAIQALATNVFPASAGSTVPLPGISRMKVVVNPFLRTNTSWALLDMRRPALTFYNGAAPEVDVTLIDDLKYRITWWGEYGVMVNNWRTIVGSNFATS